MDTENNKNDDLESIKYLFFLRLYYGYYIKILDTFCGGIGWFEDEHLNRSYQYFIKQIDVILNLEQFKELAKKKPSPFLISLIGDIRYADFWDETRHEYSAFMSEIDHLFHQSDLAFTDIYVDLNIKKTFEKADEAMNAHTKKKEELANQSNSEKSIGTINDKVEGNNQTGSNKKQEMYFLLTIRDREIWVRVEPSGKEYLIGKPHGAGSNFELFDYIRKEPPKNKISRKTLPKELKEEIGNKKFSKVLIDIGFTDQVQKIFFYKVGKDSLYFRGNKVSADELIRDGVDSEKSLSQLKAINAKKSK